MKLFTLPTGNECRVFGDELRINSLILHIADVVELTRICLTEIPLDRDDARLKLVDEIRESIVKQDATSGQRWLVLDALRRISLRKWRTRRAA